MDVLLQINLFSEIPSDTEVTVSSKFQVKNVLISSQCYFHQKLKLKLNNYDTCIFYYRTYGG